MASPLSLRAALWLEDAEHGQAVLDVRSGQRHPIPARMVDGVRAIFDRREPADPAASAWLDARALFDTARTARVEDWAQARLAAPARSAEPPIAMLPGSRFSCHGCGLCCESYVVAPIDPDERVRILAHADRIAPHVATPPERWFVPREELREDDGPPPMALAHDEQGRCIFLDAERRCAIHVHAGQDVKPFICRRFPLQVSRRPDMLLVSLRPECETLSRSRADGAALDERHEWVAWVARNEPRPLAVPPLVRVAGEVFVPYVLARTVERRAMGLLEAAATVEGGLAAVRDLVLATAGAIPPAPDVAHLERADRFAAEAPADQLREACGPADARRGLATVCQILDLIIEAGASWIADRRAQPTHGPVPRANDRFAVDVVEAFRTTLAAAADRPAPVELDPEPAALAARAAETGSGLDDGAVLDFVRDCLVQLTGGARPLVTAAGLVYGMASIAFTFVLAGFGARLLAARRGARSASGEDWNHALAVIDRSLRLLSLEGAASLVVGAYADLFACPELGA